MTNLTGIQDTFDLKIIGNAIQFDYIVDPFSGAGSGNSTDPYNITNCTQLQEMMNNLSAVYQLVNNINCSNTTNWNAGAGFIPIGNSSSKFTGTLIGNDYNITDLYIYRSTTNYVGLFGYTNGANITNLSLINVNITGKQFVGSCVGYETISSVVSNVFASGVVDSTSTNVGGLIGSVYESNITNSVSDVDVSGKKVGGITGYLLGAGALNSYISNSKNTGDVHSYLDNAGGLVGEQSSWSYVERSF